MWDTFCDRENMNSSDVFELHDYSQLMFYSRRSLASFFLEENYFILQQEVKIPTSLSSMYYSITYLSVVVVNCPS